MSAAYESIEAHETVLKAFGYWPAFHDAEVRSLVLDRNGALFDKVADARVDLYLHALEWTKAEKPMFNHHLVHLRFHDVEELALQGFNHQNAIFELKIEEHIRHPETPRQLKVTLLPAFGLAGSFCAASGRVLSVAPCDSNGNAKQEN